jgi:uncharacterized repeat protein (TIGR01451 family)
MSSKCSIHLSCAALALASFVSVANAQVVARDYRGTSLAGAPSTQIASPKFSNGLGAASLTQLLAIEMQANAVARTVNESSLEWPQTEPRLCVSPSTAVGGTSASAIAACNANVMGRIAYTVVRMPVAGTLGLYIAHDDDTRIDLSDQIGLGANYRSAAWNLPVGQLSSYTSDQSAFERVGSVASPGVGSCLLMRVVWVNTGGRNYLRMAYRTSATGANQFFASSELIDPADSDAISRSCSGAVLPSPTVQVIKSIPSGRAAAADQFRLSLRQDGQEVQSLATTANLLTYTMPATTVSSNPDSVVTIGETAASGTLAGYQPQARCLLGTTELALIRQGNAGTPTWRLPSLQAGQQVVCTISNTRPQSNLVLTKTSSPAAPWRSGQAVIYTLTARNDGPDAADGTLLSDPLVPGLSCNTYSCSASNGAQCSSTSGNASTLQGTGILLPVFPVGGLVQVSLSCTVSATGF